MNALDVAPHALAHLPHGARQGLARTLRAIPAGLRYGSPYRTWRCRIRRAASDPAFAARAQDAALVTLIDRARFGSPAHRERLGPALGFGSLDAAAVRAAWHRVPVLRRADVLDLGRRLCATDPARLDACILGDGASRPLSIFLDRGRETVTLAFLHEAWARAGFAPHDTRAVFRGLDLRGPSHMQEEPMRGELRLSVLHLSDAVMEGYREAILDRRIAFLDGYPSALATFAAFLLRRHGPLRQIRGLLPTSERLAAPLRAILERAFPQAALAPVYGLREKAAFATEVPGEPDTYAFDPLFGLTELVDAQGRPVTRPGQSGFLLATGLLFPGMPLIRYETGDRAELVEAASAENGRRLIVRRIRSRQEPDEVVGRSGRSIPLSGLFPTDDALLGVCTFQFVQEEPGRVTLHVVPSSGPLPDFTGTLLRVNRALAGELELDLAIVSRIPTTLRGKRRMFDRRPNSAHASVSAGDRTGARRHA
ncbi:hypothetical protein [Methylobacterium nodulans]|uniref:Coenzyme F390 synthetase-like protein n=1 Tax=Methylobacterium nodulans (strain LMG 21967 / CNCM I-2342 / ORS 2060) TaxID=460265 RepID=B8IBN2_METNO|nr:hypothetical protein [Methylobacterium nodulans]ACL59286.1 coenzyme F390 synthetase-like protein [Methylobacterium nodulans ORS 2060]